MPFFIAMLALQVLCAVHVVRTGRPMFWIYIVIFVPTVGMLAYLFAEVLPDMMGSPRARRAATGVVKAFDPGRDIRAAERRMALAPTTVNRAELADAYLRAGQPNEAKQLLEEGLVGHFAGDPGMLHSLARAQFARGEFTEALQTLDRLQDENPGFQSNDAHLLYARSLEGLGRMDDALREYRALEPHYAGQEARFRYAMALKRAGNEDEGRRLLEDIAKMASLAPRHVRRTQAEWFDAARAELKAETSRP